MFNSWIQIDADIRSSIYECPRSFFESTDVATASNSGDMELLLRNFILYLSEIFGNSLYLLSRFQEDLL